MHPLVHFVSVKLRPKKIHSQVQKKILFLVLILIGRCQICFGLQTGCTDVTLERVFWGKLVCNASLKVDISSQRAGLILFLTVTNLFLSLSTCNCSCVEVIACIIAYHVFHIGLEEFSAVVTQLSSLVSVLLNGVWVTDRIRTGYRRFRWCDCPPPQRTDSLQCYSSIQPMLLANFLVFFILSHFIYL